MEGAKGSKERMGEMCMLGKHVLAQSHRQEGKRKRRSPDVSGELVLQDVRNIPNEFVSFFVRHDFVMMS